MSAEAQLVTFTAASASLANFTEVGPATPGSGPSGMMSGPAVQIAIAGTSDQSSGTATLMFVLAGPDDNGDASTPAVGVICRKTVAVTVSTRRTNYADAGGDYVAIFTGADLGNNRVPIGEQAVYSGKPLKWYVGCTALATITELKVWLTGLR